MFKVVIVCLYDVVYEVATMLEKAEAIDLAVHVEEMLDCKEYVDLMVKDVLVRPM